MKNSISLLILAFALVGCGSSGGGGGDQVVQPVPGLHQGTQVGFYAQTQNFVTPGFMNMGSTLSVSSGMTNMLGEAMGVCNREHSTGGLANCQTWLSGAFDIVIYADGGAQTNQVRLIVRAVPGSQMNNMGWYSYSLPSFKQFIAGLLFGVMPTNPAGYFNPMVLDTAINPINQSKGFELRSFGPRVSQAYNRMFQLVVNNGKLEDPQFGYTLFYNGIAVASGQMVRCQSQYCALDSSFFRAY